MPKNPLSKTSGRKQTCHHIRSLNSTTPEILIKQLASFIWPNTIALRLCLKLKHQRWSKEPAGATVDFQQKMPMKHVDKWSIFRIIYGMVDLSISFWNSMILNGHLESGWNMEASWTNTGTVQQHKSCLLATKDHRSKIWERRQRKNGCLQTKHPCNNYINVPANIFTVIPASPLPSPSWIKNQAPDHWSPDKPGTAIGWHLALNTI